MAKNYSSYYASRNDSSALEQSIYLKLEAVRGEIETPSEADFCYTLPGSVEYNQPVESSPHRSGRHHNDIIKSKKELSWTLPLLFNIDESLQAPSAAEIDSPVRLLYKSALGKEDPSAGLVYDSSEDPSVTFSLFECGDKWAKQARGCFVDGLSMTFPGDGNAQAEFSGMGGEAILVGIGKSTVASIGKTVTLQTGEGKRFPVGSVVMLIKDDGVTRSIDTLGTSRTVTAVSGDAVTLSGADLMDADGSVSPVYLCYYEPALKLGISNPITGLKGSIEIDGMPHFCVRNCTITIANAHEPVNYCFGKDALGGSFFVPASRMTATASMEINLSSKMVEFYNSVQQFEPQAVTLILGDEAGRHLKIEMPRIIFQVPSISVPESGSIPVTFEGNCYQSVLDAADEIKISFI